MKNIVIVSHKFLTQPDDDLVIFLNKNIYENVLHIRHSFSDATDRCSYYSWYKNGNIFKEYRTLDYKIFPETLIYIKEYYFTLKWILTSRIKWDFFIGMDGLCVLFGNTLRFTGFIKKTVFWAIDFVPKSRFRGGFKDAIYHIININGYKKSDEMWDLSPRMLEAREKFLGIKLNDYKSHKIIPYGVWTDRIETYTYDQCDKTTLVFMGHLLEKQGVQLVIKSIPKIIKILPDFKFKIIGDGIYKKDLLLLAKEIGVLNYCFFLGKIDDIKKLENEIAKSAVAIAPYVKELDTWTYYADPGKIKTYLASGMPVLLTDIPWNSKIIENKKCGRIIETNELSIVEGVLFFMNPLVNPIYRKNSVDFSKSFDYNIIFKQINF